jgi:hypothetical protein
MIRNRASALLAAALLVFAPVAAATGWTLPDKGEGASNVQSILFQEYLDALVDGFDQNHAVISGCAVTAQGSPNMTVAVATGVVISAGTHYTVGAGNGTITTADATNPRLDLVVANSAGAIAVRAGTPGANPKPPNKTAGDVLLAVVFVPAADTAIQSNQITDLRVLIRHSVLQNADDSATLEPIAAEPAPPAAGLKLYAKSVAGRTLPKIVGPSGLDTILQVGLHGNAVFMLAPQSGTTAPTVWGGTITTAATMSVQQTIASANPWQATWRKRFQTSTTAGNASGMRTAYTQWFRGNAAGFGGFFFRAQFGQNLNLNGGQKFVGLCASTAALATSAGAVAALVNMAGVGFDTTDASTGNWFFYRNDGSGTATKVDLGSTNAARNTTHGYDLVMFTPPNGTDLFVRITNLHNGATVLDTSYNTDLPAVNVGLAFKAEVNNGAVAAADNIEVAKVYIESDY